MSVLCAGAEEQFTKYWAIARKRAEHSVSRYKCKVFHLEKGLIMETKMASNRMFILHAISQPIASTCFNTSRKIWCNFSIVDMDT